MRFLQAADAPIFQHGRRRLFRPGAGSGVQAKKGRFPLWKPPWRLGREKRVWLTRNAKPSEADTGSKTRSNHSTKPFWPSSVASSVYSKQKFSK